MKGSFTRWLLTGAVLTALGWAATGCGKKEEPAAPGAPGAIGIAPDRIISIETMASGARLYQEHCAQCHGPEAQGHPDWQTPGVIVAPPLNGSGNDWKRSREEMIAVIKKGAKRKNELVMPGWEGRLTDQEIGDIITWYQALWPTDVYDRWRKANVAPATPKG